MKTYQYGYKESHGNGYGEYSGVIEANTLFMAIEELTRLIHGRTCAFWIRETSRLTDERLLELTK